MNRKSSSGLALLGAALLLFASSPAGAQISLGTAQNFGVLGGSTVTNTGATTVNGNVGVSPGSAVTGFPPGVVVGGAIHSNDAVAMQAQNDLTTAYNNIAATPCTVDLTGQDLGGLTLTPGVYCFAASAQLSGALTLDALGNSNALFLFKIGSTLTTATGSSVTVINNGGSSCNKVYWQVGSSATIGNGSSFVGDILALTSITLTTGANTTGRALARNGAVTLDTDSVNTCGVSVCPIITVNPATLPNGTVGTPYSQSVSASGGTAPYTFSVSSGALPGGLILNPATGAITGTPTTAGTFTFTITATDANGCTGIREYTITIASLGCPAITLSPSTLPPGRAQVPYSQSVTASGGTTPYTYTIASGVLPTGLSLDPATGLISGTPQQSGLFNFTIRAMDTLGCVGARPYTLTVTTGPPTIAKAFGAASVPLSGTTTLTFTLFNPNSTTVLTGVGFSDTLPAGLVVATPNGQTPACGGGTITAAAGSSSVSWTDVTLGGNAGCSLTLNVTGTSAGTKNNTTTAVTSNEGGTGNTASASLAVVAPPTIGKAFGAASISAGGTTSLTLTITNPAENTVALTGVAVTDALPAGLVVATPSNLSNTCGGAATATTGSGSVSLTGGGIATSSSCTVSLNVTSSTSGDYTNTTGVVMSTNGGPGGTAVAPFTVSAAAATHFTVSAPGSATAGTAFSFTVTALDQFNNTVTGYTGTVHFTSSDAQATLPADSTLTNGVGTFSATLRTASATTLQSAGSQAITATDTVNSSIAGSATIGVSAVPIPTLSTWAFLLLALLLTLTALRVLRAQRTS